MQTKEPCAIETRRRWGLLRNRPHLCYHWPIELGPETFALRERPLCEVLNVR